MKARIYPPKSYVKNLLEQELSSKQTLLDEESTKLAKLTSSGLYTGTDKEAEEGRLRKYRAGVSEVQKKLDLINQHGSPEIAIEIEL